MPDLGTVLLEFVRDDMLIIGAIFAGCAMTMSCLERRNHFALRGALCYVLLAVWMIATSILRTVSGQWMIFGFVRYGGLFVLSALVCAFLSRATFCQVLFAVTVSYSIQNMCERLIEIPRYSLASFPVLLDRACLLAMFVIAYFIYYRLCLKDTRNRAMFDFSNLSSRMMLLLSAGVVAISVCLDLYMRGYIATSDVAVVTGMNVMSAIYSLLTIVVSMSHLRETDSQKRAQVAAQMLHAEQGRYEREKQIHDAINIKCHDIRHQIAALGEEAYGGEIRKIGKLVDVYDTAPHTHCAALDVVLAGRTLSCNTQGVKLTCMADGRRLGFMEDSDIYALFGNIMDNALDAVMKVEEPERRMICLTVSTRDDLLFIKEENFFLGDLFFEEGLPVTTKQDTDWHGFGTRSLRILTQKYGGDMQIAAKDGVYRLSIMLPIPQAA